MERYTPGDKDTLTYMHTLAHGYWEILWDTDTLVYIHMHKGIVHTRDDFTLVGGFEKSPSMWFHFSVWFWEASLKIGFAKPHSRILFGGFIWGGTQLWGVA